MKNSLLYDDPVITDLNENISDDMTDTLMKNLEEKIGGRLGCATSGDGGASNPRICVTPTPNIYESTAGPRTCVTPVPVERNDHINIHLHCENDASVISVSDSEKCLDCSVLIAENSKRNHFEYEKMQTYFETGNEHTEIDVTTHNTFAHKIPLGVEMDTNRTKLSNFISLSKDNSNDIINLPHSFPMDVTSLPSFVNIDHSQNLPHGFPMDITSLPSVMNIEHSQNDDNLDPKSPCNHTVIEPDRHCRDQSKEDIGNGVVMNFPITEKTLCFNNLSDTKEDNATEETVKNSLKIHSSLVNGWITN